MEGMAGAGGINGTPQPFVFIHQQLAITVCQIRRKEKSGVLHVAASVARHQV
jgi:hypothetical protein